MLHAFMPHHNSSEQRSIAVDHNPDVGRVDIHRRQACGNKERRLSRAPCPTTKARQYSGPFSIELEGKRM
jgi:hypothetical protein